MTEDLLPLLYYEQRMPFREGKRSISYHHKPRYDSLVDGETKTGLKTTGKCYPIRVELENIREGFIVPIDSEDFECRKVEVYAFCQDDRIMGGAEPEGWVMSEG